MLEKSTKDYSIVSDNNEIRVLAGSKGVGRFALAKLGKIATVASKKDGFSGVVWTTNWSFSSVSIDDMNSRIGTKIIIQGLRTKWNKKKVKNLADFLSKTYNDNLMRISVIHPETNFNVSPYIPELIPGENCLATIDLTYDSTNQTLVTDIFSDEFSDSAIDFCKDIDIKHFCKKAIVVDELENSDELNLSKDELKLFSSQLGDFSAKLSFTINPTKLDVEKFLYKHQTLPYEAPKGVILYRNAFSISSYEGKKTG